MEVTYLGHSSFKLRSKDGAILITDPFESEKVGLPYPKQKADIVTISHNHDDHNALGRIGEPNKRQSLFVIEKPGEYEVEGVEVIATKTYHDTVEGKERGENLLMIIRMDGIIAAHLGDIGHQLSEKEIERIGQVDVLFVPTGGVYTIDESQAGELIESIQPSIVIPMHYKRPGLSETFKDLSDVEAFLTKNNLETGEEVKKLKIEEGNLPEDMQVVVMNESS